MGVMDALGRTVSRLLSDDSVFATLQKALLSSLDARRALDRNIERILAGANLPSERDLERVIAQLGELDRELSSLSHRVTRLSARLERPATPPPGREP